MANRMGVLNTASKNLRSSLNTLSIPNPPILYPGARDTTMMNVTAKTKVNQF